MKNFLPIGAPRGPEIKKNLENKKIIRTESGHKKKNNKNMQRKNNEKIASGPENKQKLGDAWSDQYIRLRDTTRKLNSPTRSWSFFLPGRLQSNAGKGRVQLRVNVKQD